MLILKLLKLIIRIKNLNSEKSFIHYDRTIKNKKSIVKKNNMKIEEILLLYFY